MDLKGSFHLKVLPDLSTATKLEILYLDNCGSLVEIPSSFSHLLNLKSLLMENCGNLQVIPPHLYLPSLEIIKMQGCSKLRTIPFIPMDISETSFDEPPSVGRKKFEQRCNGKLKRITHLHMSLRRLDLSYTQIERIPDCIRDLHLLGELDVAGCTRLSSFPKLPASLMILRAEDCESLETVFFARKPQLPYADLNFINCFKLAQLARREILLRSFSSWTTTILPGSEVPAEFDRRATGNILTIRLDGNNLRRPFPTIRICVVVSPNYRISEYSGEAQQLMYRQIGKDDLDPVQKVCSIRAVYSHVGIHLVIAYTSLCLREESRETVLEFSCTKNGFDIIECGAYICAGETREIPKSISPMGPNEDTIQYPDLTAEVICEPQEEESLEDKEERTDCWSWLFPCFDLSHFVRNIGNLVSRRRQ